MNKLFAAETPTSSTVDLLASIPGPIRAFLAVIIVLLPIITEVKGWTKGPLNRRVTRAAEEAAKAREERDGKWEERDRRVTELEEVVETLKEELGRLRARVSQQDQIGDLQNALLVAHGAWDRTALTEISERGGTIGPPPPLYVYVPAAGGILPA